VLQDADGRVRQMAAMVLGKIDPDAGSELAKALQEAGAHIDRGLANTSKGEYNQDISEFIQAIELNPKEAEVYYRRGSAYGVKGEYDKATADLDRAIEFNSRFAEAYIDLGTVYYYKKEYDRAILNYNKAIELNPASSHVR